MDINTIIQMIGLAITGAQAVYVMAKDVKPPKDFQQPLINEINSNVALLDDFFKSSPKKKTTQELKRITKKLKTTKYDKLLEEYVNLKKIFSQKKSPKQDEPLYVSIHSFYSKIEELKELIASPRIRPAARLKNILARGRDILQQIDEKKA